MANVQHNALTGSALHETKGADAASANTVHKADGAGGTSWSKITEDNIDTSDIKNINKIYLNYEIADINTAASYYVVAPLGGTISKIWTVLHGATSSADTTIKLQLNNVDVTNSTVTIAQSGSAAGDVDSATPSGANTVAQGGAIEIVCGGEGASTVAVTVCIEITCT